MSLATPCGTTALPCTLFEPGIGRPRALWLLCCLCVLLWARPAAAQVSLAGFAFGGDHGTAAQRFPHSFRINQSLRSPAGKDLNVQVLQRVMEAPKPQLQFTAPETTGIRESGTDPCLSEMLPPTAVFHCLDPTQDVESEQPHHSDNE